MKNIAIITGATGGIGREFVRKLFDSKKDLDEIWVLGRNEKKLNEIKEEFGSCIVPFSCDLSDKEKVIHFIECINQSDVSVWYLINSAGLAKMGRYSEFSLEEIEKTIDLNCKTLTLLCHACILKMSKGSRILNISSASSFQPNPYIALSWKIFLKHFDRSRT